MATARPLPTRGTEPRIFDLLPSVYVLRRPIRTVTSDFFSRNLPGEQAKTLLCKELGVKVIAHPPTRDRTECSLPEPGTVVWPPPRPAPGQANHYPNPAQDILSASALTVTRSCLSLARTCGPAEQTASAKDARGLHPRPAPPIRHPRILKLFQQLASTRTVSLPRSSASPTAPDRRRLL